MKPPRPGYGKNFCVRWLSTTGETLYTQAASKEVVERLIKSGHWHPKANPELFDLRHSRKVDDTQK